MLLYVRGRGFGNVRAIGRLKDRVVVNSKIANGGASKVAVEQIRNQYKKEVNNLSKHCTFGKCE
jgi:hypothetical protein